MSLSVDGCEAGDLSPASSLVGDEGLFAGPRSEDASSNSSSAGRIESPTESDMMSYALPASTPGGKRRARNVWTAQEDAKLRAIVEEKESKKVEASWAAIAVHMGSGRTGKQCRDRYLNYLRGGIKKGPWTAQEEQLLTELHEVFGARWSSYSKIFEMRTDNDIKNKWYSMTRKKKRASEKSGLALFCDQQGLLQIRSRPDGAASGLTEGSQPSAEAHTEQV